jgi:hypothetical protein
MDTDFSGGRNKKRIIQPLNDISTPKIPSFGTPGEHLSTDDIPAAAVAVEMVGAQISPNETKDGTPLAATETAGKAAVMAAVSGPEPAQTAPAPSSASNSKKPKRGFFLPRWTLSKRWTIVIGAVTATLICGGAAAAYLAQPRTQGGSFASKKPAYTPKVTTVASSLSGLQVDESVNTRPVTGVMIENSQDARPQSGLNQAGIVFEAIAEGGITRFLALFQDTEPSYIGPVRSARPYYVQWCMSFDCALAHAGGSPEALANIKGWSTKDLDQFANGGSYQRVTNRYAPHNLYTSMSNLHQLEAAKGFSTPSFTPLVRKKEAASTAPNASSIDVAISSALYNSHYDYDSATNSYKRSQAGAAHMTVDANGAEAQITPKVIVALITTYGVASDKHSSYGVTGSGEALVFQDGTVTHGAWHKDNYNTALSLTDDAGATLKLNPGQTWFVALPSSGKLSYH